MKVKRIIIIISIIIICTLVVIFIKNNISVETSEEKISEYTPEEEISDEQSRETLVTLYFLNSKTNKLKSEGQLINAIELLENPYKVIVENLIKEPNNKELKSAFPKNTKLLDATLKADCVTLNFSKEILDFKDETEKFNIINCILNSLTQLNEVSSIQILVDGKENDKLNETYSAIYSDKQ